MNGVYAAGRLEWWNTTGTREWMLLDPTYTPDLCVDQFVADVAAFELTDGSYARQTLTGLTISADGCDDVATADAPVWATLGGATDVGWVVAYRLVTNDADSPLMGVWRVEFTPTGVNFAPPVTAYGLVRMSGGCSGVISP